VPAPAAPDRPTLYGSDGRPLAPSTPAPSESTPAPSKQIHDKTPSSAESPARPGWERAGRLWELVEAASIHVPGVSTMLFLGKRVGWKMVVLTFLVVGTPLGEYSFLSYGVNYVIPKLAGNLGVTFESEEWSFHPFAFKAVVRNVRMRPEHDPTATPVFTAGEIEFQGSPQTVGHGIVELLTFRPFHSFHAIAVLHGELHLERSLTGHLNLTDYYDAVPEVRKREISAGAYQVNVISFTDLAIHYVEHVAGYSGNGIVETTQANIHFDGISGAVSDIRPSDAGNVMPTNVRLTGRSSDGLIDITGKLGLAEGGPQWPAQEPSNAPRPQLVSVSLQQPATTRAAGEHAGWYYDVTIAMHNIGAAAFARVVPTHIMATAGTINGGVRVRDHVPVCEDVEMTMQNVRFAPNPALVPAKDFEQYRIVLEHQIVNKVFNICSVIARQDGNPAPAGDPSAPRETRGAATLLTIALNEQGTAESAPIVRQAVALDSERLTGNRMANAAISDVVNRLAQQVGQSVARGLGPESGQLAQQAINGAATPTRSSASARGGSSDNPLTKGVKGIGSGFKKLFGGGKDRKNPAKPK
jgi:hypothetical protein